MSITLISKHDKDYSQKQRKLQTNLTNENQCKILIKTLTDRIQKCIKSIMCHKQVQFIPGIQRELNNRNSNNIA